MVIDDKITAIFYSNDDSLPSPSHRQKSFKKPDFLDLNESSEIIDPHSLDLPQNTLMSG